MRLKWFGVLALVFALALTVPRAQIGANLLWDSIIVLVSVFGVILVIIDCHTDKKKIHRITKEGGMKLVKENHPILSDEDWDAFERLQEAQQEEEAAQCLK